MVREAEKYADSDRQKKVSGKWVQVLDCRTAESCIGYECVHVQTKGLEGV